MVPSIKALVPTSHSLSRSKAYVLHLSLRCNLHRQFAGGLCCEKINQCRCLDLDDRTILGSLLLFYGVREPFARRHIQVVGTIKPIQLHAVCFAIVGHDVAPVAETCNAEHFFIFPAGQCRCAFHRFILAGFEVFVNRA